MTDCLIAALPDLVASRLDASFVSRTNAARFVAANATCTSRRWQNRSVFQAQCWRRQRKYLVDLIKQGRHSRWSGERGVDHAAREALGASVIDKLLSIAVAALDPERPPVVSAAAARVLLVLSADVRPKSLSQMPQFLMLIQHCSSGPDESLGARLRQASRTDCRHSCWCVQCPTRCYLRAADKRSTQELGAAAYSIRRYGNFGWALCRGGGVTVVSGVLGRVQHINPLHPALPRRDDQSRKWQGQCGEDRHVRVDRRGTTGSIDVPAGICVYSSRGAACDRSSGSGGYLLRCALSKYYTTFIDDTIGCFLRICEGDSIAVMQRSKWPAVCPWGFR